MVALLYIEAARRCLTDEVEEVMYNRSKGNNVLNDINIYDETVF